MLESAAPPIAWRKLHGILNALEMQVEDGRYHPIVVARLCEAFLAEAELYPFPDPTSRRLAELVAAVVASIKA